MPWLQERTACEWERVSSSKGVRKGKGKGAREKGDAGQGKEHSQTHLRRTLPTVGGASRSGKARWKNGGPEAATALPATTSAPDSTFLPRKSQCWTSRMVKACCWISAVEGSNLFCLRLFALFWTLFGRALQCRAHRAAKQQAGGAASTRSSISARDATRGSLQKFLWPSAPPS